MAGRRRFGNGTRDRGRRLPRRHGPGTSAGRAPEPGGRRRQARARPHRPAHRSGMGWSAEVRVASRSPALDGGSMRDVGAVASGDAHRTRQWRGSTARRAGRESARRVTARRSGGESAGDGGTDPFGVPSGEVHRCPGPMTVGWAVPTVRGVTAPLAAAPRRKHDTTSRRRAGSEVTAAEPPGSPTGLTHASWPPAGGSRRAMRPGSSLRDLSVRTGGRAWGARRRAAPAMAGTPAWSAGPTPLSMRGSMATSRFGRSFDDIGATSSRLPNPP